MRLGLALNGLLNLSTSEGNLGELQIAISNLLRIGAEGVLKNLECLLHIIKGNFKLLLTQVNLAHYHINLTITFMEVAHDLAVHLERFF
jgi:hypothetical protein